VKYFIFALSILLLVGCSSSEKQPEIPNIIGHEFLTIPDEPFCVSLDSTKQMVEAKRSNHHRRMKYLFDDVKYCFVYQQDQTVYVVRDVTERFRSDRILEVYFYEYGFSAYCIEEYCGHRPLIRRR
jgi:hypothetical protein